MTTCAISERSHSCLPVLILNWSDHGPTEIARGADFDCRSEDTAFETGQWWGSPKKETAF